MQALSLGVFLTAAMAAAEGHQTFTGTVTDSECANGDHAQMRMGSTDTSFVERLNLTIRQGSAYLRRCSPCHARCEDQLRGHVELLRCHYNFVRPHRALKFGRETRTPAIQAGVVSNRLTWSDIFTAPGLSRYLRVVVVRILVTVPFMDTGTTARPTFSWPHEQWLAA